MNVQEQVVEQTEVANQEPVIDQSAAEGQEPEASEKTEQDQEEQQEEEEHKKPNRLQKRIDNLTREKYRLRAELDAMKNVIQGNQQQAQSQSSKPVREQFNSDEDFIDALTDYKTALVKNEILTKVQQPNQSSQWEDKVEAAREAYDDYDEVIDSISSMTMPAAAIEAINTSDIGPDIAYYLGNNPKEVRKLATMPQGAAARYIGTIEARLESDKKQKVVTTGKPITGAPKPPATVKPVASAGPIDLTGAGASKLSTAEWLAARNQQLKEKYKR